jgi:hypothetical protein
MELANILRQIWRHKVWLGVGVVVSLVLAISTAYQISVAPPSLDKRTNVFGAASSEILVDSVRSSLGDLDQQFAPLSTRAAIYARLIQTGGVKRSLARYAHVNPDAVSVTPPQVPASGPETRQSGAAQRASDIREEGTPYRIELATETGVPVITVYTRAPTGQAAQRLADGTFVAVRRYVKGAEREALKRVREQAVVDGTKPPARLPVGRRVDIRELGAAHGGVVNSGADKALMVLTFIGSFLGACLLILLFSSIGRGWRQAEALERRDFDTPQPAPHEYSR